MTSEINWSDWLDFSSEQAAKTPKIAGVYMMHAAMKILYIGSTQNIQQTINESLSLECLKDAKRFRYAISESHEEMKNTLLKEYMEKHNGSLPKCM